MTQTSDKLFEYESALRSILSVLRQLNYDAGDVADISTNYTNRGYFRGEELEKKASQV